MARNRGRDGVPEPGRQRDESSCLGVGHSPQGPPDDFLHRVSPRSPACPRAGCVFPITLTWSGACDAFLKKNEIYLRHMRLVDGVIKPGTRVTIPRRTLAEPGATMPLGRWWTMGAHSYVAGRFDGGDATVGRYSNIAIGCSLLGDSHPIERLTMHPFTYDPFYEHHAQAVHGVDWIRQPYDKWSKPITIGNAVWIGLDVTFGSGVHIGDGAVVASHALVTKDVAPYSIVGGVPARPIRMRFPDELIERLLRVQWWRYEYSDLPRDLPWDQVPQMLDAIEEAAAHGTLRQSAGGAIDLGPALLAASLQGVIV